MADMPHARTQIDPDELTAISAFLSRIASDYPVTSARLYGSRARGDSDRHSDADVAVFLKGAREAKSDLLRVKLAMADIAFEILLETNILISPLPIWEDEWNQPEFYENPRLLENIRREGVVL
jgi:antitoxin ChpS